MAETTLMRKHGPCIAAVSIQKPGQDVEVSAAPENKVP